MSTRTQALAERVEKGASELLAFVETLSDTEWQTACPGDGRPVGVVVHHVASAYLVEVDLVRQLAAGHAITGVTMDAINQMNAQHAEQHARASKAETLDLLRRNSALAADAVRALSDEELDRASPVSLNSDAPLTTQFFIEDHPLGHSFHHLESIRAAVRANGSA